MKKTIGILAAILAGSLTAARLEKWDADLHSRSFLQKQMPLLRL